MGSTRSTSSPGCFSLPLGSLHVAVGSRFAEGGDYGSGRYEPSRTRRFGIGLLQKAMHVGSATVSRPDERDGRRGPRAMPIMSAPYVSGAPEVEALLRLKRAGLRVDEVAVNMRARAHGESKLQGGKAVSSC